MCVMIVYLLGYAVVVAFEGYMACCSKLTDLEDYQVLSRIKADEVQVIPTLSRETHGDMRKLRLTPTKDW